MSLVSVNTKLLKNPIAVLIILALLASSGINVFNLFSSPANANETRIITLESQVSETKKQLERIENKVDRLLLSGRMSNR